MTAHPATPRSNHSRKLGEFAHLAFPDRDAFTHRGRWRELFKARIGKGFDGRIILEVGCADAAFLSRIAAKFPATAFVGLDWKFKSVYDAAARVTTLGLQNVLLIRGRGQDIARIFRAREIDEIWIFHPDPCDRDVELKNRLISEPFLIDAHATLKDRHTTLCLKTDHSGYYQHVLDLFASPTPTKHFKIKINSPDYWNDHAALSRTSTQRFWGERTTFEQRFIKKRCAIYYVEMEKKP